MLFFIIWMCASEGLGGTLSVECGSQIKCDQRIGMFFSIYEI